MRPTTSAALRMVYASGALNRLQPAPHAYTILPRPQAALHLPRSAMPPARPTLTPLQSLLARATYEEQVARATEARRAKAADTAAVLRGGASEVDRMHKLHKLHRPHSEVVILLNPQEWKWLAQAAEAAGPIPPRIASYLGWRTQ